MRGSPKPRVLIVDDEPAVLAALQLAFDDRPWHIEVATSVATGLARLTSGAFDLALIDKNLPDGTGVDLIRELRKRDLDLELIVITGFGSVESAVESANLGISAYLEKPFRDIYRVADEVEAALERRRRGSFPAVQRLAQYFARIDDAPATQRATRSTGPSPAIAAPTTTPAPAIERAANGPQVRVLVVASEPRVQRQMAAVLDPAKEVVAFAHSAEEVIDRVEREPFDALLVHGGNEVEVITRVRRRAPRLPIIVASVQLSVDTVRRLIDQGVTALISYAIDSPSYKRRLQGVLENLVGTAR